jgi:hypothetical protein
MSRPNMLRRTFGVSVTLAVTVLSGCGGSEPTPKLADEAPEVRERPERPINTSSEIGGLNEEEVDAAFKSSLKGLQRCLAQGSSRVEFLGGSVSFFLKIDSSGRVSTAYLEESTLGDRATERCMLETMRKKTWPKPVGGEHGLARKSFSFDPPNDVRPPTDWTQADAEPGMKTISSALNECKNGASGFAATLYVGTDGKVLAAGVTPPDEAGDSAVDCLVGVLEGATFPSPGSWPAKVTLGI